MVKDLKKMEEQIRKLKNKKEKKEKDKSDSFKLGKPKAKIQSYSAVNLVKQIARESGGLVREVPEREFVQDNRSQFFKEEFIKARREGNGWLLR